MPAQSVAIPTTPPPAAGATRTTPAEAREPGTSGGPFGRQLDAVRNQHEQSAGQSGKDKADGAGSPADGAVSATGVVAKAAPVESPGGVIGVVAGASEVGHGSAKQGHDGHDGDASADGMPQLAVASLLPFLGAALPGSMPHRGAFASSAGTLLGAHGAAAVTAGIANAARMLQVSAASGQTQDGQANGATAMSAGLEAILDAVHGLGPDDAHTAATDAAASNIGLTQLAPLLAPAAGTHLLAVAAPLGSEGFHEDLARQVTWLTSQDVKQARIRVHPEDLGPVDLKVSMTHDHVNVIFSAQHPGTVQALQQSLPQLGQMLAQHGLSLGHAEVGQHGGNDASTPYQGAAGTAIDDGSDLQVASTGVTTGAPNLLDAFA